MIKTGIIGIGRMGRIHLENLCTQLSGVEVLAVMNPGKEGQQFAEKWGGIACKAPYPPAAFLSFPEVVQEER